MMIVKNTFIQVVEEEEGRGSAAGRRAASCPAAVGTGLAPVPPKCSPGVGQSIPAVSAAARAVPAGGWCPVPAVLAPAPVVVVFVATGPLGLVAAPAPGGAPGAPGGGIVGPIDRCCTHGQRVCGFAARGRCECPDPLQHCHHPSCIARKIAQHKENKRAQQRRRREGGGGRGRSEREAR
mmetsp:Transcript_79406/g.212326  ORF Transcript_79406/g.212326 Transcript_79406/m.212326 type:complete len:180 (-) Transcript_79406:54-593(-)